MNKMMIVLVAVGCLLVLSEANPAPQPQKGTYLGSGSGSFVTGYGGSKTGKDGSETSAGSSGSNGSGGFVSISGKDPSDNSGEPTDEPTETPTDEPTQEPTDEPAGEPTIF